MPQEWLMWIGDFVVLVGGIIVGLCFILAGGVNFFLEFSCESKLMRTFGQWAMMLFGAICVKWAWSNSVLIDLIASYTYG